MTGAQIRKLPERSLIEAARGGDGRAFGELVRRYEQTVYRYAFKLCRDREKAEETYQDTFINVYRKLGSFDGRSLFSTWLYAIVTNSCLMRHRRRKIREIEQSLDALETPETSDDGKFTHEISRWEETPADILLDRELRAEVEKAIGKLPARYRIVFTLRDMEGKSTEETAKIVGISNEAAKSRLRRARAFLRDQLTPYMARPAKGKRR
ncbi:MAG TPA: sigma-70 family RNA polymerase sigma factor [Bacteroidota bacterium]|nr:sigma-70 family RNA polymerase sigma factor [Bacteroidota bacterium]